MSTVRESSINIIAEGTRIEGTVIFENISRVHGELIGEVLARDGSTLVLSESAIVEGKIHADTLIVDGFVQGDIRAKTKVVISRTGRVIGNVYSPNLQVEFGAYFEGRCSMEGTPGSPLTATSDHGVKAAVPAPV